LFASSVNPVKFVPVAPLVEILPGNALRVHTALGAILLFNAAGRIFAIEDGCIRCASSLERAWAVGTSIACPRCGWRYELETGAVRGCTHFRLQTFATRVVGPTVSVGLPFDDPPQRA